MDLSLVDDLRDLPLIERKRRLGRLIGETKNRRAIQYGEHLKGNGASPVEAGRHRLKAGGRAVSKWPIQDVAQVEEPVSGACSWTCCANGICNGASNWSRRAVVTIPIAGLQARRLPPAAGGTASAEPLVCDLCGEIELRLNLLPASPPLVGCRMSLNQVRSPLLAKIQITV